MARLWITAALIAGCAGAAPTPQIIYVTPAPTVEPTPSPTPSPTLTPPATASPRPVITIDPTSWVPTGFTVITKDGNLAYQWIPDGEITCKYSSGSCLGMYVITRDGCPSSLYVELSLLDSSGTAVGYTNAALSVLLPGQKGKLEFDILEKSAAKARIAKASCY